MKVESLCMRSGFFQGACVMDCAVACDIKMVTDAFEASCFMALFQLGRGEGYIAACGAAMYHNQFDFSGEVFLLADVEFLIFHDSF